MGRRWVVLAAGTVVHASQAAAYAGLAVLAPVLRDRFDLSLTQVGVLLGGASVGALLTLLPWGLAADRIGERATATVGLLGAAGSLTGAAFAPSFGSLVCLLAIAGAFGASSNTASGRAVTSWFPRTERGFALGVRQTSIPIGGFASALAVPPIAGHWGPRAAFLALAGVSAAAAAVAAVLFREGPIRSDAGHEPGLHDPLRDRRIWRLAIGSTPLVFTQAVVTGFVVLFLESQRHFTHAEAGAVLAGMNVAGGAGRLAGGHVSDRLDSRVGLMRRIALATTCALGLAAGLLGAAGWLLVAALVLGGGLAMSWNGLAVAAAVDASGGRRTGAALGLQQTMIAAAIVVAPLAFAPFVAATSWRAGFFGAAAFPLAAVAVLRRLGR